MELTQIGRPIVIFGSRLRFNLVQIVDETLEKFVVLVPSPRWIEGFTYYSSEMYEFKD